MKEFDFYGAKIKAENNEVVTITRYQKKGSIFIEISKFDKSIKRKFMPVELTQPALVQHRLDFMFKSIRKKEDKSESKSQ